MINVQGEDRRFVHSFGANADFDGSEITSAALRTARLLYMGGYLLNAWFSRLRPARSFSGRLVKRASHVPDVAIPAPGNHWESLAPLCAVHRRVSANSDEGRLITGLDDPLAQGAAVRRGGVGTVVITCGGDGAVLVDQRRMLRSGVFSVPFVDGTGIGDAFDAGYIYGLLQGYEPESLPGNRQRAGGQLRPPDGRNDRGVTRAQLEEFLAANKLPVGAMGPQSPAWGCKWSRASGEMTNCAHGFRFIQAHPEPPPGRMLAKCGAFFRPPDDRSTVATH